MLIIRKRREKDALRKIKKAVTLVEITVRRLIYPILHYTRTKSLSMEISLLLIMLLKER